MTSPPSASFMQSGEAEPYPVARTIWLQETVGDLRANNRDLRLILGFLKRDSDRLQKDLDLEKARNADFEERIRSFTEQLRKVQERNEILEETVELERDAPFSENKRNGFEVFSNEPGG
ncbi:hypothetical protein FA13DRAFT_1797899 [Coprinellus micaceus]|uniref:Uncharacterized protein n=1 Tax=Coprinellus micaceus TaxID=71717 RepID=A0A4Y7SQR0_COPMI|nr:hypothetical protein FA13DRAFT_1797899 [Coprinellus micaceus]